jgi:hypothetical protein
MLKPLAVDCSHQPMEEHQVAACDVVIAGVLADGQVGDRRFATERAILAIKPECFPRLPVKRVPRLRFYIVSEVVAFWL